jgi:hypothetical protein
MKDIEKFELMSKILDMKESNLKLREKLILSSLEDRGPLSTFRDLKNFLTKFFKKSK